MTEKYDFEKLLKNALTVCNYSEDMDDKEANIKIMDKILLLSIQTLLKRIEVLEGENKKMKETLTWLSRPEVN